MVDNEHLGIKGGWKADIVQLGYAVVSMHG